jgi:hypothetical protein
MSSVVWMDLLRQIAPLVASSLRICLGMVSLILGKT